MMQMVLSIFIKIIRWTFLGPSLFVKKALGKDIFQVIHYLSFITIYALFFVFFRENVYLIPVYLFIISILAIADTLTKERIIETKKLKEKSYLNSTKGVIETEVKKIEIEKNKIGTHIHLLEVEVKELKFEIENFTNKLNGITNKSLIKVAKREVDYRKKRVELLNTIISLHNKKKQKLDTTKREFLLLKDLHLSNNKRNDLMPDVLKYQNISHDIDLQFKYEYSDKIKDLLRIIKKEDAMSVNAAINYLDEIIKEEIEREKVIQAYYSNDEPTENEDISINNNLLAELEDYQNEKYISVLEDDVEKLKLKTFELLEEMKLKK